MLRIFFLFFYFFCNELQTLQLWYQKKKKKMYTKTCLFCKKYPRETLIEHQTPSRKRESKWKWWWSGLVMSANLISWEWHKGLGKRDGCGLYNRGEESSVLNDYLLVRCSQFFLQLILWERYDIDFYEILFSFFSTSILVNINIIIIFIPINAAVWVAVTAAAAVTVIQ